MTVAVLFARADSVYKTLPDCDVWDEARDARKWPGGCQVVAHPPCRLWGRLRQFAKAADPAAERQLAIDAVGHVRRFGGVLEHPEASTLWAHCGLPLPGRMPDAWGGYTIAIKQCDWGHRAEKWTWLYIVGVSVDDLPPFPEPREPTAVIRPRQHTQHLPIVTKPEREHTPPELARWLVELARRCQPGIESHPAGTLRYRDADGVWQMASPHDLMFSTVTMCATHFWRDGQWHEIHDDSTSPRELDLAPA